MQKIFQKNCIQTLLVSILCALNFNAKASSSTLSRFVSTDYHYILGELASLEGKRDESLAHFDQVLIHDSTDTYVRLRRAQELFYQGLVNVAQKECEELLDDFDEDSIEKIDTHLFLAQIYQSMNWSEKVFDQYQQVLKIQPHHFEALLEYALLSIQKGKEVSKKVLQSLKDSPDFHHSKGDIHLAQGDEGKAIDSFKKVLTLDSSHKMAALRLFQVYEYKDQMHLLISFLEKISVQDTYILSLVAQAYLKQGDSFKVFRQMSDLLWDHPLVQNFKKEWVLQQI